MEKRAELLSLIPKELVKITRGIKVFLIQKERSEKEYKL